LEASIAALLPKSHARRKAPAAVPDWVSRVVIKRQDRGLL